MLIIIYVCIGLLGLVAGVFVNELADLLPGPPGNMVDGEDEEMPPWTARSCVICSSTFPLVRLLPLADWWLWRGRCPTCEGPVRSRYAVTELAVAALWLLLYGKFGATLLFFIYCFYATVLALIFVIDLEHRLILDLVSYPAIALAFPLFFLVNHHWWIWQIFGAVISTTLFAGFYVGAKLIYRQEALGFGDVKLAALIGLLTGWPNVVPAIFYGCFLSAVGGSLLLLLHRKGTRDFMPLGTYLSVGGMLTVLILKSTV